MPKNFVEPPSSEITPEELYMNRRAFMKAAGLIVRDIVVVIDREQGARQTIEAAGYKFHAVATLRQLLDAWQRQGVLSADQRREVDAYLSAEA